MVLITNSSIAIIQKGGDDGGGQPIMHSTLEDLDFASSGHTGFQPAGDYCTKEDAKKMSFISAIIFG